MSFFTDLVASVGAKIDEVFDDKPKEEQKQTQPPSILKPLSQPTTMVTQ